MPACPASCPSHLLEPPLHQRPVLTDQRHYIGDGRKRNKIEVKGGRPTQRTSKLPSDRGPAELGERVPVQRRVQDRAIRQLVPGLVVVGDDDLHPQLFGQGDLPTAVIPQSTVMIIPCPARPAGAHSPR